MRLGRACEILVGWHDERIEAAMEIKTLAELQQPDEASLMFGPWGLGSMSAENAAKFHQEVVAAYELAGQVPDSTRQSFDRLRTIYAYGVLCYDLYTVAGEQARLFIEQALRDRFLPFYSGEVGFIDSEQQPQSITATDYRGFYQQLHGNGRLRKPKDWKLQLQSGRAPIRFDGMLDSLLRWARAEGLLAGQRDRLRDRPRLDLRNLAAHPSYHLGMPPDAAAEIADLAAIINRLWGAPGGLPHSREVVIIAWDERSVTWGAADRFLAGGHVTGAETCVVVRAGAHDDLGSYDSLYEAVTTPCQYLWGPGTLADAHAWAEAQRQEVDEAPLLDRLFILRYYNGALYLPQAVPVAAGLDNAQITGTWYLIRADSPHDAFNHQRQKLAGADNHVAHGYCRCPVEALGEGQLPDVLTMAATEGASITPITVPDTRVTMSMTPRCNRILGNGTWDIPPDDPSMVRLFAAPG
jgi:hypothetical protein